MLLQNVNLLMNPIKSKIICYHQAREIAAEGQGERKKERKRERKRERERDGQKDTLTYTVIHTGTRTLYKDRSLFNCCS